MSAFCRRLALVLTAIFVVSVRSAAQDCSALPSVFACTLHSSDRASDGHLEGSLRVVPKRIVFEAFPQVENVTLPCGQISAVALKGRNKNVVAIRSSDSNYVFDLKTNDRASMFVEAAKCACDTRH
jgi:hypothetical protein